MSKSDKFVQITSATEAYDDGSSRVILFGLTEDGQVYQALPYANKEPDYVEWYPVSNIRHPLRRGRG